MIIVFIIINFAKSAFTTEQTYAIHYGGAIDALRRQTYSSSSSYATVSLQTLTQTPGAKSASAMCRLLWLKTDGADQDAAFKHCFSADNARDDRARI